MQRDGSSNVAGEQRPKVAALVSVGRHPVTGRPRRAEYDARAVEIGLALASCEDLCLVHAGECSPETEGALRGYLGMGIGAVDVLQQPALKSDARFASNSARVAHQAALDQLIARAFADLTIADVVARLEAAGIANARMNTIHEFLEHPQLAARNRWRDVGSPVGPLHALVPPINMESADPVMGPVPALGEHTETILRELGYDAATIEDWRRQGVV